MGVTRWKNRVLLICCLGDGHVGTITFESLLGLKHVSSCVSLLVTSDESLYQRLLSWIYCKSVRQTNADMSKKRKMVEKIFLEQKRVLFRIGRAPLVTPMVAIYKGMMLMSTSVTLVC